MCLPSFTGGLVHFPAFALAKTIPDKCNWINLDQELQLYQHRTGEL